MTATLPEEVGSPQRALEPVVNGKNQITGWKAVSRPQLEFKPFAAVDRIGFSKPEVPIDPEAASRWAYIGPRVLPAHGGLSTRIYFL